MESHIPTLSEEELLLGENDSCESAAFKPKHVVNRTPPPTTPSGGKEFACLSETQTKSTTEGCQIDENGSQGNSTNKNFSENKPKIFTETSKERKFNRYSKKERRAYNRNRAQKGLNSGDLSLGAACSYSCSATPKDGSGKKGDLVVGTNAKRSRSPGGTPEEHKKVDKIPKKHGKELSYAKVAKACDHRAAIIPIGTSMELSQEQAKLLTDKLTEAVIAYIDSADSDNEKEPLKFPSCGLVHDIFVVDCQDKTTRRWLDSAIGCLPSPWEGAKFEIVDYDKLPKPIKVSINIKGSMDLSNEIFFTRLRRQNPGLSTAKWRIYSRREHDWGIHLVLGIDQDSVDFLKSNDFKLFYLVGVVCFLTTEAVSELRQRKAETAAVAAKPIRCTAAQGKLVPKGDMDSLKNTVTLKPSILQAASLGNPTGVDHTRLTPEGQTVGSSYEGVNHNSGTSADVCSRDLTKGSVNKENPVQDGRRSLKGNDQHLGLSATRTVCGNAPPRSQ